MKLIEAVVPLIVPIPLSLYFDIFDGCLQAFVFSFLTALYMQEGLE
jgi:F-type H+-transporting ATPase subunit a